LVIAAEASFASKLQTYIGSDKVSALVLDGENCLFVATVRSSFQ
jgi:hypothetical protein